MSHSALLAALIGAGVALLGIYLRESVRSGYTRKR